MDDSELAAQALHDERMEIKRERDFLKNQNELLHQQLDWIRGKVHDRSLSSKQIVERLRHALDRSKVG